jgi:regulator of replication initiation timing
MELKDVILSTLAEMEEEIPIQTQETKEIKRNISVLQEEENIESFENELTYLSSIRERLLVLFEGFQAPNNANIEAKVDLTLNFLEYILATIDSRLQSLQGEGKR